MNWTTRGTRTWDKFNDEDQEGADLCEHCEDDKSLVTHFVRESDAFGTVGLYLMCTECKETNDREGTEICDDCLEDVPTKEIRHYRRYGFSPSEGDQELNVCDACWKLPEHQSRLAEDRRAREYDEDDY